MLSIVDGGACLAAANENPGRSRDRRYPLRELAEGEGFEPSVPVKARLISNQKTRQNGLPTVTPVLRVK